MKNLEKSENNVILDLRKCLKSQGEFFSSIAVGDATVCLDMPISVIRSFVFDNFYKTVFKRQCVHVIDFNIHVALFGMRV